MGVSTKPKVFTLKLLNCFKMLFMFYSLFIITLIHWQGVEYLLIEMLFGEEGESMVWPKPV